MIVDLHLKSKPHSAGALSSTIDMFRAASHLGIKVVAFADDGLFRCQESFNDLLVIGESVGVIPLPAASVLTPYGEMIVYGIVPPDRDLEMKGLVDVSALIDWTHDSNGAIVWAHPFRDLPTDLQEEVVDGRWDWWVRKIDALEKSWNVDKVDNLAVDEMAKRFHKHAISSSGACYWRHVGGSKGCHVQQVPVNIKSYPARAALMCGDMVCWLRSKP